MANATYDIFSTVDQADELIMTIKSRHRSYWPCGHGKRSTSLKAFGSEIHSFQGQNLILNMNDKGFTVCAYNRTTSKVDHFLQNEAKGKSTQFYLLGCL